MDKPKQTRKRPSLDDLTAEQREMFADNLRERVYSTITLIAVLTVMWQNDSHHTVFGVVGTIVGTVVSLWLATLVSIRMSYRAVHGKSITRQNYTNAFFSASGLLAPAIFPIIIVIVSGVTNLFSIKTALLASLIVSVFSIFALSYQAGRKIYDNIWRLLLVSALEMSVGFVVILLKLVTGE